MNQDGLNKNKFSIKIKLITWLI